MNAMLHPVSKAPTRSSKLGTMVDLFPLSAELHASDLFLDQEPNQWFYLFEGPFESFADFRAYIERLEKTTDRVYFAIVSRATGKACGLFALINYEPNHDAIEVGNVLLGLSLRKTRQATEAFFLIIQVAFEECNCRRVVWKCDSQNKPSSEAAKRLGFCFEGLFRNHMITKGRSRDTAWFSITVEEWLDNRRQRFIDYLKDSNFLENGMQLKPLPPIIQSPKSCDVWRQKGVSRFGLHVASKTGDLLLFEPRKQWMIASCERFPADLSPMTESGTDILLSAWPIEFQERVCRLLNYDYSVDGHLDIAELWVLSDASDLPRELPLPVGFRRHVLRPEDAEVVNSGWEHGTALSLPILRECIQERPSFAVSSEKGDLAAWALTRHDGSIGVVVVKPEFRKLGLGSWVVGNLAKHLGSCYVYIAKENLASQKLHSKLGFINYRNSFVWTTLRRKSK